MPVSSLLDLKAANHILHRGCLTLWRAPGHGNSRIPKGTIWMWGVEFCLPISLGVSYGGYRYNWHDLFIYNIHIYVINIYIYNIIYIYIYIYIILYIYIYYIILYYIYYIYSIYSIYIIYIYFIYIIYYIYILYIQIYIYIYIYYYIYIHIDNSPACWSYSDR